MKKLMTILSLFFLLVLALIPLQPVAAACGVVASGVITGGSTANFGPFTIEKGSTIFLKVTNTALIPINYGIVVTVGGIPVFVNNGTIQAGETETASTVLTQTVTASASVLVIGGDAEYVGRVKCPSTAAGDDTPPLPPGDGRLGALGTNGAVYTDEDGIGVYGVDENGDGFEALFISAAELAALPDMPAENLLLAGDADGPFAIFKLTTGEYQVNIGPDAEGKVQVVIFDGIPPTTVYGYEFNVYE